MRILLDESAPTIVKKRLSGLDIVTVREMGWAGMKNGDLLAAAEGRFDVFVTADKKLRHQQDLSGRRLAVVVLPSNQVIVVEKMMVDIERAIQSAQPGDVIEIPMPTTA